MDINQVLKDHLAWLQDDASGIRADLRGADLRGVVYDENTALTHYQATKRGGSIT